MLKYIELKSGHADNGPAWIAYVRMSKTGRTVYFNGRALKRARGGGVAGNYFDLETGEEFWISGVKKNGQDRHWAGSGKVFVEAAAVTEYLSIINAVTLDSAKYEIVQLSVTTDVKQFHQIENTKRR